MEHLVVDLRASQKLFIENLEKLFCVQPILCYRCLSISPEKTGCQYFQGV